MLLTKNGVQIIFSILSVIMETALLSIHRFEDLFPEIKSISEVYQRGIEKDGNDND
jgi:hypothetical protein